MAHHSLRKGLDIPIAGVPSGDVIDLDAPATVGIDPRELRGFIPRLAAREGDRVRAGDPLLYHKFAPDVKVVSPVAGVVQEVRRGQRRVITDVVVRAEGDEALEHRAWSLAELAGIGRDDAKAQMLAGGVWPLLRTRPLDHVPDPEVVPQSILIAGMETGPCQPDVDALLGADDAEALQAAVHVLAALTDGKVYLSKREGHAHPALDGLTGVEVHTFSGPHPAGDPAVQVSHIDPPRAGGRVFTLRAWDAAVLGRLFLTGRYDGTCVYGAAGAGLQQPRFVRTVRGAPIADVVGGVKPGAMRYVRGSVLTGVTSSIERWAGFLTRGVHVLPDEVERHLLGWAMPNFGTWSFHRAFLKGFSKPSQRYDLRPGLFGGHRAIVPIGAYQQVVATPDILPGFLFKSIIAGDLEGSIKLGMLDLSEEEAALCSYVDPSKIDFDVLLRDGLELYAKEM